MILCLYHNIIKFNHKHLSIMTPAAYSEIFKAAENAAKDHKNLTSLNREFHKWEQGEVVTLVPVELEKDYLHGEETEDNRPQNVVHCAVKNPDAPNGYSNRMIGDHILVRKFEEGEMKAGTPYIIVMTGKKESASGGGRKYKTFDISEVNISAPAPE